MRGLGDACVEVGGFVLGGAEDLPGGAGASICQLWYWPKTEDHAGLDARCAVYVTGEIGPYMGILHV